MKIVVEIPDEEITAAVKEIVTERIAKEITSGWYAGREYRRDIKEVVREVIKEDKENLADRAVAAAAKSIENSAVKKMLNQIAEGEDGTV